VTVTIHDIKAAASLISGSIINTPCTRSRTLSEITGADVILKFENHQFTASFKERGALVKLLKLTPKARRAGVVAMSAGNHAQAVAYHAHRLGIPATIVMPRFTPDVKVERTRAFGAEVILEGEGLDEAARFTRALAAERNLHLVHPYDDEDIIAGQGTIALEMLENFPDLDVLVIPVGGGGLIAGNSVAARAVQPQIEIVGVETSRFPSMHQALKGVPVVCEKDTIAEGIAVSDPGKETLPLVCQLVDEIVLVDDDEIEASLLLLLEVEKTVVEGAGAAGLAALLKYRGRFRGRKVGIILSGGNISMLVLSSIIQRGLVRSGRLVRLLVGLSDVPGALSDITRILGEKNANIIEIRHQRAFTHLSIKSAEVEFVLQTLGRDHLLQIIDALTRAKYEVSLPDREVENIISDDA
jgi:threonine dehydratase